MRRDENISDSVNDDADLTLHISGGYYGDVLKYRTTEEWSKRTAEISKKGMIYVYTDYSKDEDGKDVPAIKIGDGKAYVIDLPFVASGQQAVGNITAEQIRFWNNKVSVETDGENLLFKTN